MGFVLVKLDAPGDGERFFFVKQKIRVGRAEDADLGVQDASVSRMHAVIEQRGDGRFFLDDLGSANGTTLNGKELAGPAVLVDGDIVSFGTVRFRWSSSLGLDAEPTLLASQLELPAPPAPLAHLLPASLPVEPVHAPAPLPVPAAPGSSPVGQGTVLDGRYEVIRELGEGGMAKVYLVRHLGLQSEHALKVLNPELSAHDEVRARFLAEGRIQARIRHPNIVAVTEIVTQPVAGLVMDYVPGATLGEHLRKKGAFTDLAEATRLFTEVLDAVGEAHRHGVVHRDLKPENIILGRNSRGQLQSQVTDFGIARVTAGNERKTRFGARMGTPHYMSPEQVRGAENADHRSDIFSLGAILYEWVTGRGAFAADSEFDVMQAVVKGTYVRPEQLVPSLPGHLRDAIVRALAVRPEDRFQSCEEFAAALRGSAVPRPAAPVPPVAATLVPALTTLAARATTTAMAALSQPATVTGRPTRWQLFRGALLVCGAFLVYALSFDRSLRRHGNFFGEWLLLTLGASVLLTVASLAARWAHDAGPRLEPVLLRLIPASAVLSLPVASHLDEMLIWSVRGLDAAEAWSWLSPGLALALTLATTGLKLRPRFAVLAALTALVPLHAVMVSPGDVNFRGSPATWISTVMFAGWVAGASLLSESAVHGRQPDSGAFFPPLGPVWDAVKFPALAVAGSAAGWGLASL